MLFACVCVCLRCTGVEEDRVQNDIPLVQTIGWNCSAVQRVVWESIANLENSERQFRGFIRQMIRVAIGKIVQHFWAKSWLNRRVLEEALRG